LQYDSPVATKDVAIEEQARLSGVVLDSLQEPCTTDDLARRAFHSRTQFHSLFRALIEETPAAMRRRLLLERAAWTLANTTRSVTDIALDANYGSLEAFTRAFRKAYSTSPSLYRRIGTKRFRLPSPNGIHFVSLTTHPKGAFSMDLLDRFAGNDSWHTRNLLTSAAALTEDQLDRPLKAVVEILPWREKTNTLRQLLENIIFTKEVWTAALTGKSMDVDSGTPPDRKTPAAMLARLEATDAELSRVLCQVNSRGAWDETFVDALCEPPETFTYGGVFAHIMTFNAHRRIMALDAFRELGVHIEGFGCPIEYEQQVTRS
jgi:AraC family transcriptional regulator